MTTRQLNRLFHETAEAAGIKKPATLHSLRHSLPVLMAIVFELGAGLSFFAASSPADAKEAPKIQAVNLVEVPAQEPQPEAPKAQARQIKTAAAPPMIGFDGQPVELLKGRRTKKPVMH